LIEGLLFINPVKNQRMAKIMTTPTVAAPAIQVAGGYSNWNFTISPEADAIFKAAVNLVGVKYTPIAFATQVVAGTNYAFLCKAAVVVPNAPQRAVKLYIFKPLPGQGEPHVTQILDVFPAPNA